MKKDWEKKYIEKKIGLTKRKSTRKKNLRKN